MLGKDVLLGKEERNTGSGCNAAKNVLLGKEERNTDSGGNASCGCN